MFNRNKKIPVPETDKQDLEYVCPPASWSDMTGLIPAITEQDGARSSYEDMYPYLPEYNGIDGKKKDIPGS